MVTKTCRRPMKSDSQAHSRRPEPLAIEMSPTIPAAATAVACVISCAMGEACEMMEIPAVVLRNRIAHSAYHCQLRNAPVRVRSRADRVCAWLDDGSHPRGREP